MSFLNSFLSRLAGLGVSAIVLGAVFVAPASAQYTYSFSPTPADLYDLDHYSAYAWRVDGVTPLAAGYTFTGATLSFKNIHNWDNTYNKLFIHLLDTAKGAGVTSFIDSNNDTDIQDNFAGALYNSNPLVTTGTGNTYLTEQTFPGTTNGALTTTSGAFGFNSGWVRTTNTQGTFWNYTFTQSQLAALETYYRNGNNFALGFDPDCHLYNDGITLNLTVSPGFNNITTVPEPSEYATAALFALPLAGMVIHARRRRKAA